MKKIGIVGWKTGDNSFGVTVPYLHYFSKFGVVEIITPNQEVIEDLDLLVLPGGKDLDSTRYGQMPSFHNTDGNPYLEAFDKIMLPKYIAAGIPIFGICRGFQTLNVHFGGSLRQHWNHGYSAKSRSEIIHELILVTENIPSIKDAAGIMKDKKKQNYTIEANSLHHQVVSTRLLAESMVPLLLSDKNDGVIEGFKHNQLPIAGVQYHPEELYYEPFSDFIISKLLTKQPLE